MNTQIFVNLPVKNLERSVGFFTALGYRFNPQFTNEDATCMVVDDGHIYVMLLVEKFFATFTPKPIADARRSTEVLLCLSCESRSAVDALVAKAVAAGASTPYKPKDHGFMYQHGFEDLDGHLWELMWMDPEAAKHGPASQERDGAEQAPAA
ncbi:MAG: VOC family protein [Simplicispira suum]|uniref:VOC family protein n=1 Tax=Simplicispira suum TaxID=2109915 RepID=UPI001C6CA99B|nr:VOC family protein [Simplicispira suum]MBW7833487.1 VOC family protein [Simplicispira suum]